jgi:hypothetical protein
MWKKTDPFNEIIQCLEAEKTMLTSGKLEELSGSRDRKSELLDALGSGASDAETLHRIREKAAQNSELLRLAANALREVSARVRSLSDQKPTFQSYTAAGGRCKIGGSADQVSRKF